MEIAATMSDVACQLEGCLESVRVAYFSFFQALGDAAIRSPSFARLDLSTRDECYLRQCPLLLSISGGWQLMKLAVFKHVALVLICFFACIEFSNSFEFS